jgi:hypothetical protein
MARFITLPRPERATALARIATALAVTSMGALAVGALAVGALAIRRLAIGSARIRRLEIDELVVAGARFPPAPMPREEPSPAI